MHAFDLHVGIYFCFKVFGSFYAMQYLVKSP